MVSMCRPPQIRGLALIFRDWQRRQASRFLRPCLREGPSRLPDSDGGPGAAADGLVIVGWCSDVIPREMMAQRRALHCEQTKCVWGKMSGNEREVVVRLLPADGLPNPAERVCTAGQGTKMRQRQR